MYNSSSGALGKISNNSCPQNYNPSIVVGPDDYPRVCWLMDLSGGQASGKHVVNWDYHYPSYYNESGFNTSSVSINLSHDPSYDPIRFVWSENYGINNCWGYISDGSTSIEMNMDGNFGRDVQLCNGSYYTSTFSPFSSPYYFRTFANSLGKHGVSSLTSWRGLTINNGNLNYYYTFGNLKADGNNIDFVPASDTISYFNINNVNNVFETKPFQITDKSKIYFNENSGFLDTAAAANILSKNGFINFTINLLDASTNNVVGTVKDIKLTCNNLYGYQYIPYQLSTEGTGTQTVRARVTVTTNLDNIKTSVINGNGYEHSTSGIETKSVSLHQLKLITVKEYALDQNYPNPFNPTTTISYRIKADGFVTLKIYDILGNEVKELINEYKSQGNYNVNFDAGSLASGVYFYQLRSGDFTATKKLLLLK